MSGQGTDSLRVFLADRDAFCPDCRYSLRGLAADRCPECGEPLHLVVATTDRWIGRLLAAIIPLAAAATAATWALLVMVLVVIAVNASARPVFADRFIIWMVVSVLLFGIPPILLARPRGRGWFRRRTRRGQNTIVIAAWLASGAAALNGFLALLYHA